MTSNQYEANQKMLLDACPGWCGNGGPRVKPEESMKHLVFSETEVQGGRKVEVNLSMPEQTNGKLKWPTAGATVC